jgi:hypothetical protein
MDIEQKKLFLDYFIAEADKMGMPTARSGGIFWWRCTEEAWQQFRRDYGLCSCGNLFSLNRMTCVQCGESDIYEVWE